MLRMQRHVVYFETIQGSRVTICSLEFVRMFHMETLSKTIQEMSSR